MLNSYIGRFVVPLVTTIKRQFLTEKINFFLILTNKINSSHVKKFIQ